ncbi:ABC transporter ATP-binding protein [Solemya pervernicosa gill symbiont]|uniref:ATP-binding protein Uup n=2 Tax=Gammaproteobacteria incertae sedis TaxID=118884 RepID=A0A1T2L2Z8_9GAMM|nr:ATP-binding cassette domain-containing protein [Candidatus Reidiella endopervernicosa]OOZ39451.1 ABC transporter ATP-binding protein [Solemya pervernicosa gill symbiont]QKQ26698.1 ATP-binding cassette domain-containing protein [Candidatus Reidiella endopervernicosa]
MPLLTLDNITLHFGPQPLLDGVALQIDPGERLCLVGRNGAGKSTLLKMIAGEVIAEDGTIWRDKGVKIAYLAQDVPVEEQRPVFEVVADGLGDLSGLIADYHQATVALAEGGDERDVERLANLQHQLEAADGWLLEQRVERVISRLELPADASMAALSGGMKRRVLLARALVTEPDLLLLDEPTNHLDIESIIWLEEFLLNYNGALLFITHDRDFVRRLATRIVEIDRGQLTSWPGNYDRYLEKREERLSVELAHNAQFDKELAQEEVWIRQGIKARRTRNEGRVRALKALRNERSQRREQTGKASFSLERGERSGKLVVEVEGSSVSFPEREVIRDFSVRILRGDRVGIIGPNGAGKTTLIKLLLGQLQPDAGRVELGTKLEVAYFDQQREQLEPQKTVIENLNQGKDTVSIGGRDRHVISYLKDFLFTPDRVHAKVHTLSGGERNRLLLARLFTRPANLLVMDEPTNDLDVETLELLEELLSEYDGTLLLVSHDRAFLDNVVTSTLVFEGNGHVAEYVGGYQEWLRQRSAMQQPSAQKPVAKVSQSKRSEVAAQPVKKKKLSYKIQRELDALPALIEALETEQVELEATIGEASFYQQAHEVVTPVLERLEAVGSELEQAYTRWGELEEES